MGLLDKLKGKDDDDNKADANSNRVDAKATERSVDFSDVHATSSSTPADATRTYTVEPGDSLSKIAKREYGDAGKWQRIYAANRNIISNPDLIQPGQVLTIPRDI
jgi:nucleoid-associated protein YgaU